MSELRTIPPMSTSQGAPAENAFHPKKTSLAISADETMRPRM
jgi:hypothetical protein